jgi:DNA-binding transcriptional LysR family regulator
MQLNETLAFVTVVEAGSFTEAGRRLGMPKSTLSKQVSRLEERLGARLLQRTTRKLSLTETGQAYFDRCSAAIEDLRNAERVAQDVSGTPKGKLKVTAPFDFGRQYLAGLMADFHRRYPDIEIELLMSQRRIDMFEEGIDVALRGGAQPDSSLVAREIFGSELLFCASPAYLDRRGRPTTVAELADHETVSMPMPPGGWRLEGPDGPIVVPMRPWLVANEWGYLRQAQLDGLGIGPNIIQNVYEDLRSGRLERVLPQLGLTRGGGLYAVYPSRQHLSPKVRVFVDFLVETLGHLDPSQLDA